jgi:hypothetical protein
MVPDNDDVRDDDPSSEGGHTVSRWDVDATMRQYEERLPEMPEEAMPTTVQDVLNMVGAHDHSPRGFRHPGVIEVVVDDDEGQGGTSDE